MRRANTVGWFFCVFLLIFHSSVLANLNTPGPNDVLELVRFQDEFSMVKLKPARLDNKLGIAVVFEGSDDLHYYAKSETAPAKGLELKIKAESEDFEFGQTVFPKWEMFKDPTGQMVEVYAGNFSAFIPIISVRAGGNTAVIKKGNATVTISGIACTSMICLAPFEKSLSTEVYIAESASLPVVAIDQAQPPKTIETVDSGSGETTAPAVLPFSTPVYFVLAVLAGVSINIMPCVLPVIPLILMRLIEQSKKSDRKRIFSGIAFCSGVILFFAVFALVSAIINLTTGAVLDLNSLFRYPAAVIILFLAIVFFGLVMLDIVTLALPSAILSKQGQGSGIAGTLGMGFFAGVLSTPCSGALLGFVLVWSQTQPLITSSTAIILMGVGMSLPYAVIILIPSLLNRIPKPGTWMDIFKKCCGFLLFFIAVKLTLAALDKNRLLNVLTYGVIFSFAVWMWGKWVSFSTPSGKKWTVRLIALILAFVAGFWLLPGQQVSGEPAIEWRDYDAELIENATVDGQAVLIKFTADWCTNCKVVDKKVYKDLEVVRLIEEKNVLPVKADTTQHNYQATIDFKKIYGEAGNVPATIVLQPGQQPKKLRGIFDKQELITILEALSQNK